MLGGFNTMYIEFITDFFKSFHKVLSLFSNHSLSHDPETNKDCMIMCQFNSQPSNHTMFNGGFNDGLEDKCRQGTFLFCVCFGVPHIP